MRKFIITSAAALCAAALPATAAPANQVLGQPGAQTAQPSQQQRTRADDPNRRICVTDRLSDSRIRRRICRTQAEWETLQDNDPRGE